ILLKRTKLKVSNYLVMMLY
ncbi:hypothetical protein A5849_001253, partial [Enterococcus sp. 10F3_DIV0382]